MTTNIAGAWGRTRRLATREGLWLREKPQPLHQSGRHTSCVRPIMQLPRKNRAAAQTQGITNCATARRRIVKIVNTQIVGTGTVSLDVSAPWPELFVPERLRRLLSTAVHNQYRCGAYCSRLDPPLTRLSRSAARAGQSDPTPPSQAGSFPFVVDSCCQPVSINVDTAMGWSEPPAGAINGR